MKITNLGESIIITLTPDDWKYHRPGCDAFIAALKQEVPAPLREYNPLNKEWIVSAQYRGVVELIRDEHLVDKNQQSLF